MPCPCVAALNHAPPNCVAHRTLHAAVQPILAHSSCHTHRARCELVCHASSSALPLLQTTPLSRWHPVDGVLLHRHCLATWPLRVHCVRAVSSPPPRRCPFTTGVSLHYHRRRVTVAVAAAAAAERRHPRPLHHNRRQCRRHGFFRRFGRCQTAVTYSLAAVSSSPRATLCSALLSDSSFVPRGPLVTAAISSLPLLLSLSPHHPVPVLAGRHCTVTSMLPSALSSDRFLCRRTRSRHRWLRPTRSGAYVCISSLSVICVHMLWLLGYDLA